MHQDKESIAFRLRSRSEPVFSETAVRPEPTESSSNSQPITTLDKSESDLSSTLAIQDSESTVIVISDEELDNSYDSNATVPIDSDDEDYDGYGHRYDEVEDYYHHPGDAEPRAKVARLSDGTPVMPNLLEGVAIPEGPARTGEECSVCLDPPVHPVTLPCGHVFCFLCAKVGLSLLS